MWARHQRALKEACARYELAYDINEGRRRAFYGPKIDIKVKDSHRAHLAVLHRAGGLQHA